MEPEYVPVPDTEETEAEFERRRHPGGERPECERWTMSWGSASSEKVYVLWGREKGMG